MKKNTGNIDFLWETFIRGDDKSFSIIYQQQIDALLAYGHRLCSDKDMVSDAIQEIFMDLYLRRKKLDIQISNLKSYLFVSLRNSLVKKMKIQRRFDPLVQEDDEDGIPFYAEYSIQDEPSTIGIPDELKEKLRRAIAELPDRQKEIIFLKFEQELEYHEISGILNISRESARKLFYRSMLSLRKTIDPEAFFNLFLIFLKKKHPIVSTF